MERGSDKHGPRIDEELKDEDEALLRGGQAPHVEAFRETEPLGDYPGTAATDDRTLSDEDELPAPIPGEGPRTDPSWPPSAAAPDPALVRDIDPDEQ